MQETNKNKCDQDSEHKCEDGQCFHCQQVDFVQIPGKKDFIIRRKYEKAKFPVYMYKKSVFDETLNKKIEATCYRYYSSKCNKCMQLKIHRNGTDTVDDIIYTYC